MTKSLYIETVGCQMNVLDSELVSESLRAAGYKLVDNVQDADIVLFNTCSVRSHAEDKVYSALGRLKHCKDIPRPKIVGVIGCMAQKDRELIFKRAPHVDLVVGPGQLGQIVELLEKVSSGHEQQIEVSLGRTEDTLHNVQRSFQPYDPRRDLHPHDLQSNTKYQAMVRIMFGCDKFCTYCIVPSVRGPEQSRGPDEIIDEVRQLSQRGCLEITLLGQTVNSYKYTSGGKTTRMADLLYRLDDIDGLRRIKFVSNCPKHMTDELLAAVRDLPKVSPYLHVPAQSGSNSVLRRMKRGYTVEQYREMLERIRETVPEAAITSDFIVGFCGETDADYQQTVDLVREARFKNSFIFKYSTRPGTKAHELFEDDVSYDVKRWRNNDLLAIQNAISLEDNRPLEGRRVEVLVEGPSKAAKKKADEGKSTQLVGRTADDRIIVFDGPLELTGQMLEVKIEKVDAFTLFGVRGAAVG
jgi:tRNA-2-methylthio-N6-dimethylallyladenosine synthase